MADPLTPTVHLRGAADRLDALLDLMSFVARPRPLSTALDELPQRIARLFPADVCSIYILEGEELVLRGNVGFPASVLGEVRLPLGEGITGLAVECMRPISLDVAAAHAANRNFPELDEERFPIFMAVPVAGPGGPLGALVLQRHTAPAFTPAEVELAAALTGPIAAVMERAHIAATLRRAPRSTATTHAGARRMTLTGRSIIPGRAVGTVCALHRPRAGPLAAEPRPLAAAQLALNAAMTTVRRTLEGLERRALALGRDVSFLGAFRLMLDDTRLPQRVLEHVRAGGGLAHALSRAGAEATRAAERLADSFGLDRARALDDLCEALAVLVTAEQPAIPRDAVLVGDQITLFDLLVSARWQPVAITLASPTTPVGLTLLSLLGVPAVVDVASLFRWVADGDIVLVDGDHGLLRVNPSRSEIGSVRAERKRR